MKSEDSIPQDATMKATIDAIRAQLWRLAHRQHGLFTMVSFTIGGTIVDVCQCGKMMSKDGSASGSCHVTVVGGGT